MLLNTKYDLIIAIPALMLASVLGAYTVAHA